MSEAELRKRVLELLTYDPETGIFTWNVKRGCRAAGAAANSLDGKGYIRIKIDGCDYRAHRLAWLYVHGKWPKDQLDHIDLSRTNNALANLREADNSQNNFNRRAASNNTSGQRGVRFEPSRNRWRAEIKKDGRVIYLGRHKDFEKAATAYRAAATRLFGDFARVS